MASWIRVNIGFCKFLPDAIPWSDAELLAIGPLETNLRHSPRIYRKCVANCLCPHSRVILVFVYEHQINTWVSAQTVRHGSTYLILFLTRHIEPTNYDQRDGRSSHIGSESFIFLAFWWWRHNRCRRALWVLTIIVRSIEKWYVAC